MSQLSLLTILVILPNTDAVAVSNTVAQPIFDPRERVFDAEKGRHITVNKLTPMEMGCYFVKDPSASEQGGAKGRSYRGLVSYTISGRRCKNWLSDNPWKGAGLTATPDKEDKKNGIMKWGNGLGNHNYCRNPDPSQGFNKPWCFTMDPKVPKEECNIDVCKNTEPEHYWNEAQDLANTMKDAMSLDEPTPCTCKRHSGAFGKDISRDFYGEKEDFASEKAKAGFLQNKLTGTTKDGKPCFCQH